MESFSVALSVLSFFPIQLFILFRARPFINLLIATGFYYHCIVFFLLQLCTFTTGSNTKSNVDWTAYNNGIAPTTNKRALQFAPRLGFYEVIWTWKYFHFPNAGRWALSVYGSEAEIFRAMFICICTRLQRSGRILYKSWSHSSISLTE